MRLIGLFYFFFWIYWFHGFHGFYDFYWFFGFMGTICSRDSIDSSVYLIIFSTVFLFHELSSNFGRFRPAGHWMKDWEALRLSHFRLKNACQTNAIASQCKSYDILPMKCERFSGRTCLQASYVKEASLGSYPVQWLAFRGYELPNNRHNIQIQKLCHITNEVWEVPWPHTPPSFLRKRSKPWKLSCTFLSLPISRWFSRAVRSGNIAKLSLIDSHV